MIKKKWLVILIVLHFFSITACGLFEPDQHKVTVTNQRSDGVMVDLNTGPGETFMYFTVQSYTSVSKTVEKDNNDSYTITITSNSGVWDTNNSGSDITIIVPSSGKPYVK